MSNDQRDCQGIHVGKIVCKKNLHVFIKTGKLYAFYRERTKRT